MGIFNFFQVELIHIYLCLKKWEGSLLCFALKRKEQILSPYKNLVDRHIKKKGSFISNT